MRQGKRGRMISALLLGVAMTAGCADSTAPGSMAGKLRAALSLSSVDSGEVCEVINFSGLSHGTVVSNQFSVFGSVLNFSAIAFTSAGGTASTDPRIYDGNHTGGPDFDLESTTGGGLCADCATQGNMLVIQDVNQYPLISDNAFGGKITVTGWPSGSYIKSFTFVDRDPGEPLVQLIVNGVDIAGSQIVAANTAQTINTTQDRLITSSGVTFILGAQQVDPPTGSGAIDDIRVCIRQALGGEGCTPGYWKNHTDSWPATGYSTSQKLSSVFSSASSISSSFGNTTLLNALQFGGGPGVLGGAEILARAAVSALLNAAHPGVDYPETVSDIITAVNSAFASGDRATMLSLASTLDTQNNLGCPLN